MYELQAVMVKPGAYVVIEGDSGEPRNLVFMKPVGNGAIYGFINGKGRLETARSTDMVIKLVKEKS